MSIFLEKGAHAHILAYIRAENFMGTQETIIYRLVMINSSYDAHFRFRFFGLLFAGKMGVATMRAPNSLEPPNPTKKLTPCTGQLKSQTHVFEISRPGAPTPFKILM